MGVMMVLDEPAVHALPRAVGAGARRERGHLARARIVSSGACAQIGVGLCGIRRPVVERTRVGASAQGLAVGHIH